jgi:hypothetical protein
MAAVASLLPWAWLGISQYFVCIDTDPYIGETCFGLYLNTPEYWSSPESGNFGAAQAAAVFAIFSTALGFMSFSLLVTATCFELEARRILTIVIMQGVAAFCSILTLIAGSVDICGGTSNCSQKMRVETGAGFEIFAFLIYLAAIAVNLLWYRQLRREATPKEEARSLVEAAPRPVAVSAVSMPEGGQRIEREYVDETGQVIKEVTVTRPDHYPPQYNHYHRHPQPQPMEEQESFSDYSSK